MTIDALPAPPSTADPATFNTRADALIAALPDFVSQVNAAAAAMDVAVTTGPLDAGINAIVNGQFRIAQAGTSFAAPGSGAYDLDGWQVSIAGAAVVTIAQASGVNGRQARTVTVTTADTSIAAGDIVGQFTAIEGYDAVRFVGNTFTLGFWVKSSVTGIHCVSFYNGTSSYIAQYTISVANTWEYKSIIVIGGTQVLASVTAAAGLYVSWTNLCGSTFHTTAGAWNAGNLKSTSAQVNDVATIGNVFALQDVTLNLGTSPAVDSRSYAADLARCQRYYSTARVFVSATAANIPYPQPMRAAPTVTGGGAGFIVDDNGSSGIGGNLIAHQTAGSGQTLIFNARL